MLQIISIFQNERYELKESKTSCMMVVSDGQKSSKTGWYLFQRVLVQMRGSLVPYFVPKLYGRITRE